MMVPPQGQLYTNVHMQHGSAAFPFNVHCFDNKGTDWQKYCLAVCMYVCISLFTVQV